MPAAPVARRESGLTLLELLVVVIVMTILGALAIPTFDSSTMQSKEATAVGNLSVLRLAIERYRIEHGDAWPDARVAEQLTGGTDAYGRRGTRYGPYLRTAFPRNPLKGTSDVKIVEEMPMRPWGFEAWIYCPATGDIRLNTGGRSPSGLLWYEL